MFCVYDDGMGWDGTGRERDGTGRTGRDGTGELILHNCVFSIWLLIIMIIVIMCFQTGC